MQADIFGGRARTRMVAIGAGLLMSTMLTPPALGQQAAASGELREIETVTVTAERRETRLQDTPIAVSAISGDAVQQQHLNNLGDIAAKVPSVTFDQVNHSEAFIAMRGTWSQNDAAGIDQGVSVFVDDVPTTGFGDDSPYLYDLQSVEVLRGPQGTLFGRNVTGGAILLRTLPPSFDAGAKGTLTYGSDNLMELAGYVTGALVDNELAGKLTADFRRRDDYLTNATLGGKTYGENVGSLRGQVLWTPTANLRVLVGADYLDDTGAGKAQWIFGNFQPSLFPTLKYSPDATNQGTNARTGKKVGGLVAHVDWTLPWATLTSISGYRNVDDTVHFSTSGDPFNSIVSDPHTADEQFSQEFHLTSPTDQPLTWVAGVFLLNAHRSYLQTVSFNPVPGTRLNVLGNFVPGIARFKHAFVQHANQHVAVGNEAIFGEATYAVTDALKLTVGARYSFETKSGHTEVFNNSADQPVNIASGHYSKGWDALTPKALVSYQPDPDLLLYASATKGYESGGYDTNGTSGAELASAYNPEKVWSYEAGAKAEFFDRLQLNAALYDAEYTNLQTRNFDPVSGLTIAGNAAQAHVRGVEVESELVATDWLTLGGSYSYANARYGKYILPNPGGPATNNTGHIIPFTPKQTFDVVADTNFAWPETNGEVEIGGDILFRSSIQFDDFNDTPAFIVKKSAYHGVLNLHAQWTSSDGHIEVSLWAKNVTDSRSIINNSDLSNFYDTPTEFNNGGYVSIDNWTDGRLIGLSLTGKI